MAAIPDQPKITNQKTVRVGDKTDTAKATKQEKADAKTIAEEETIEF